MELKDQKEALEFKDYTTYMMHSTVPPKSLDSGFCTFHFNVYQEDEIGLGPGRQVPSLYFILYILLHCISYDTGKYKVTENLYFELKLDGIFFDAGF